MPHRLLEKFQLIVRFIPTNKHAGEMSSECLCVSACFSLKYVLYFRLKAKGLGCPDFWTLLTGRFLGDSQQPGRVVQVAESWGLGSGRDSGFFVDLTRFFYPSRFILKIFKLQEGCKNVITNTHIAHLDSAIRNIGRACSFSPFLPFCPHTLTNIVFLNFWVCCQYQVLKYVFPKNKTIPLHHRGIIIFRYWIS